MGGTWARWGDVIIATLVALPLAGLLAHTLGRWRGDARNPLLEVAMVVGTAPWLWMILTPSGHGHGVVLVPLSDLAGLWGRPAGVVVEQLGGNLLVFAALGFCLPMRSAAFASLARVGAVAVAASAGVEVVQYVLDIGRQSSIDDVLVNAAGALLAAACSRRWWARPA
jgi:glycopeptide antibiotics resistance protein